MPMLSLGDSELMDVGYGLAAGCHGTKTHIHPELQDVTYLEIGSGQMKLVKNQDESALDEGEPSVQ